MNTLDWFVIVIYLSGMIGYSVYLGRSQTDVVESFRISDHRRHQLFNLQSEPASQFGGHFRLYPEKIRIAQ